jgi:hypothetical protein
MHRGANSLAASSNSFIMRLQAHQTGARGGAMRIDVQTIILLRNLAANTFLFLFYYNGVWQRPFHSPRAAVLIEI